MRIYDINPTDQTAINPAGRPAPLDPMRDDPIIPSGATSVKPPVPGERQAAQWDGEQWALVPDWRGHQYWLPDGTQMEITELGVEPPANALDDAPPTPLADVANQKRAEIETARDAAINAGFEHAFGDATDTVQMRQRDRENITGLAVSAQRNPNATFQFRALTNAQYELTAEEMLALADAAQVHVSAQYQRSWERKEAINAALAAENRLGIEAVNW